MTINVIINVWSRDKQTNVAEISSNLKTKTETKKRKKVQK